MNNNHYQSGFVIGFIVAIMIGLGIIGLSMGILYEEPPISIIGVGLIILGVYEKYINHIDRRLLEEGIKVE